jgi:hypothetical protein
MTPRPTPTKKVARFILAAAGVAYTILACCAMAVLIGLGLVPMILAAVECLP